MLKKLIRWLIVLAVVFFLLLQSWQLFVSIPLWKISSVEVSGNLYWPESAILSQFKLPMGESIFAVNLKELAQQAQEMPQIVSLKPRRKLPSTIILEIEERLPWAKTMINNEEIVLGEDGKILNLTGVEVLETGKLLHLTGLRSIKDLEPFAQKFYPTLSELKKLFPENSLEIQALGPFDIQCIIDGKLLLVWGSEEMLDEKTKILKAVLPVIQDKWQNVAYIDLRSPKNLAIRYRR